MSILDKNIDKDLELLTEDTIGALGYSRMPTIFDEIPTYTKKVHGGASWGYFLYWNRNHGGQGPTAWVRFNSNSEMLHHTAASTIKTLLEFEAKMEQYANNLNKRYGCTFDD